MTGDGKTTAPKSCPLSCSYFNGYVSCIHATLRKLSRSKCYKMLICKGCCVVIGACQTTAPSWLCKNLPKVKKSCRDHFKSGNNNFATEVLENTFNSIVDQLLDIFITFQICQQICLKL